MTSTPPLDAVALRNVPDALLLDFGGVIVETSKVPDGKGRFARSLGRRLERGGIAIDASALERSIEAGLVALKHWKHAQSRRPEPLELGHREIVHDFLASDLPVAARALLTAEAQDVLVDLTTLVSEHRVRPGIPELLDLARERGIPVGIVSNAHSGRSHRMLLARLGIEDRFGVQCYSDEVGVRKPHPRIIELAAAALGTVPARCWYVGDTQDRDVVAGRRAGVGAVVLTRSHHTDAPPFAVAERADAVFATPEGVRDALAAAQPAALEAPRVAQPTAGRAALLIDHGGVISASEHDEPRLRHFAAWLAALLAEPALDLEGVLERIGAARAAHGTWKAELRATHGAATLEVEPLVFWRDWFGAGLSERARAVLTAEAHDIMGRFGRAKSRRALRRGVRVLLERARELGMPVVVVSNTVSGTAVRAECAEHGLRELIAAFVCSDELGVRKPDVAIVEEALRVAAADPDLTWFLGDKPQNDAVSASAAGIRHRVLVRGGATADPALDAALASGLATAVVDDPGALTALLPAPAGLRAAS